MSVIYQDRSFDINILSKKSYYFECIKNNKQKYDLDKYGPCISIILDFLEKNILPVEYDIKYQKFSTKEEEILENGRKLDAKTSFDIIDTIDDFFIDKGFNC